MGKWKEVDGKTFKLIFRYYDYDYSSNNGKVDYYKNCDGNLGKIEEVNQVIKCYIYKGVVSND